MIAKRQSLFLIAVATMTCSSAMAAETEYQVTLKRNPFERPAVELLKADASAINDSRRERQEPMLRGVLVAGDRSVVDFGGVILQIGESSDGYRLLSVGDGEAVFRKNGRKVSFSLRESNSSN